MFIDKSNAQFVELCKLTTALVPKYGSRPAAFKEACRQRPDLAAAAIRPTGERVLPIGAAKQTVKTHAAAALPPEESALSKAIGRRNNSEESALSKAIARRTK